MPIAPRAPPKAMRGKCERGHPFSTPGLRFHGVDRADVFNNIRVRAIRCGECALNPPTAQHLPRRRPSPAPTQRHALPEHFRSPTQPRRTPAGCAMHARSAQCIPRCPHNPFPAEDLPSPRTATRPPKHFCSPTQPRCTPADLTTHSPPKNFARPRSATLPPLLFRFGHKKNGTAQWMCDAECLGRPSCGRSFGLVSRALFAAVAGRWRVGVELRPQPWALRSRRCGRVLRA